MITRKEWGRVLILDRRINLDTLDWMVQIFYVKLINLKYLKKDFLNGAKLSDKMGL